MKQKKHLYMRIQPILLNILRADGRMDVATLRGLYASAGAPHASVSTIRKALYDLSTRGLVLSDWGRPNAFCAYWSVPEEHDLAISVCSRLESHGIEAYVSEGELRLRDHGLRDFDALLSRLMGRGA